MTMAMNKRRQDCKSVRYLSQDIEIKSGLRDIKEKCKFDRAPGKPGPRRGKPSNYALQLMMKQTFRRFYGVQEKQFRRYYKMADKAKGSTGNNLMRILETRLDNVVYRAGFASTRSEARQMVSHGHVLVNGRRVKIPSYLLSVNDVLELSAAAKKHVRVQQALALAENKEDSAWIEVDAATHKATFTAHPDADQMPHFFKVNLVVELYSK